MDYEVADKDRDTAGSENTLDIPVCLRCLVAGRVMVTCDAWDQPPESGDQGGGWSHHGR